MLNMIYYYKIFKPNSHDKLKVLARYYGNNFDAIVSEMKKINTYNNYLEYIYILIRAIFNDNTGILLEYMIHYNRRFKHLIELCKNNNVVNTNMNIPIDADCVIYAFNKEYVTT